MRAGSGRISISRRKSGADVLVRAIRGAGRAPADSREGLREDQESLVGKRTGARGGGERGQQSQRQRRSSLQSVPCERGGAVVPARVLFSAGPSAGARV